MARQHLSRRVLASLAATSALAVLAQAHEREFTQSRDWFLPYKGESELEWRSFFDTSHGTYNAQFEYEYGVTEWFAIEPGLELKEKEDGSHEIEAAEIELRFHFLTFDYEKFLPALNVEYEHPFEEDDGDEPAVELKGVISRYGKNGHDFAVNVNVGKQLSGEKETESEGTAGWIMPLTGQSTDSAGWHHGARAGIEVVDNWTEGHVRLGPLIAYRPSEHLNFLFHYGIAVDDRDDGNFDELTIIAEWEF